MTVNMILQGIIPETAFCPDEETCRPRDRQTGDGILRLETINPSTRICFLLFLSLWKMCILWNVNSSRRPDDRYTFSPPNPSANVKSTADLHQQSGSVSLNLTLCPGGKTQALESHSMREPQSANRKSGKTPRRQRSCGACHEQWLFRFKRR